MTEIIDLHEDKSGCWRPDVADKVDGEQDVKPIKGVPIFNLEGVYTFSCYILSALIVRYAIKWLGF